MASFLVAQRLIEINLKYLGSYIQTLREKIEPNPKQTTLIRTGRQLSPASTGVSDDRGIGALQSNLAHANVV